MIFLFFGSSLACLEPELELFEVWADKRATNHHHCQWHQLQTAQTSNSSSSGSRQAREEPKKKENHLHTISKMMGTLVHVQLYTFTYRKPVIRPQNMPKTADRG